MIHSLVQRSKSDFPELHMRRVPSDLLLVELAL